MKYRLFLSAIIAVGVLWLVVLGVIQNWSNLSPAERARRLDALADQMNGLTFSERQKFQGERGLEPLFKQMTEEERMALLDKTLPKGFAQVIDAINKMKPEDRQRMVAQAVERMKEMNPQQMQSRPPEMDAAIQKVTQVGFTSYLQNASAQTKLDMAPLIEQIQMNMQGVRGEGQ
jgi:hypothetical protein